MRSPKLPALPCFLLMLFLTNSAQAQEASNQGERVRELLNQLDTTMANWQKLRDEEIVVLDLAPAVSGDDEKTQLEKRLEALQDKKISNREWHAYWEKEGQFTEQVLKLYNELVPSDGQPSLLKTSAIALESTMSTARANATSLGDAVATAAAKLRSSEIEVKRLMKAQSKDGEKIAREIEVAKKRLDGLLADLEKLLRALSSEPSQKELAALDSKHKELEASLKEARSELSALEREESGLARRQSQLKALLTAESVKPDQVSADIQGKIGGFLSARSTLLQKQKALQSLQGKLDTQDRLRAQMLVDLKRFSARKPSLTAWLTLTQDKVANQDRFYQAIDAEIDAVNERLRVLATPPNEGEKETSTEACKSPLAERETPFERQRTCLRAYRSERVALDFRIKEAEHRRDLANRRLAALEQLTEAQIKDTELLARELKTTGSESARSAKDVDEAEAWRAIWNKYNARAKSKRTKLTTAVVDSKKERRLLNAKLGVLHDLFERLAHRKTLNQTNLSDANSPMKWTISLAATIWMIAKVGWAAPLYVLLAFFLLRSVGRYRDRQEAKAEAAETLEAHPELVALEKQLEEARREGRQSQVAELADEIGQAENRLKDEAQRVKTIARVAAQAVGLVIYVATGLLVLDALTIDIGPILGGAAIFGLAISFGSQSLVKDVVSGFFILLENQFAVGDVVSINGSAGTVEKVTLRRTVLRDIKGSVHNITNGSISSVKNMTQGWARVVSDISVAYGTDLDRAMTVVNTVGEKMYEDEDWTGKLSEAPTCVGVTAFGESEITIRAMFKTRTFHNWGAEREFNYRIKNAFEAEGIEIPFPQRDIRIVQEGAPEKGST